nr:zinc finger, CCHC-type, retrotransposon Gag domain protein [Tanacetum cinerariifolium]
MVNTRTDANLSAAVQTTCRHCFPRFAQRFARSSVPVLDRRMLKIFDVMGCEDAFKTRLAVYKFEGNALAWWKAYKQAKGGDAWLITVTWADFKNRPLSRVITGTTVIITTIMGQTGKVVVTTIATTTTTLAVTTRILVMGVTRETGVSSPIDLPILVLSSPGVPLRAIPTQFALLVDVDTQESVVELL